MTDEERTPIAESLLALAFSLRPKDSPEKANAWTLSVASTAMARAILASVGPTGDAEELLALAAEQVRQIVTKTQSDFIRGRLTAPGGGARH